MVDDRWLEESSTPVRLNSLVCLLRLSTTNENNGDIGLSYYIH